MRAPAKACVFTLKSFSTGSSALKHVLYAHACPNRSSGHDRVHSQLALPLLHDHAAGTAFFAVPFALVLHWVPTAFGDFFILGVLNIAFAQLLVILNLVKNRIIWFLLPLVGSLKMGRFCHPSADMATYLYPKALEEAHGIGAPIDQMNEGEKDCAVILPSGMLIESVTEAYYARQAALPTSSLGSWPRVTFRVYCPRGAH